MSNDEILSVVQELPLHVSLKLKRNCLQITTSPTDTNMKSNEIESGQSSPNDSTAKVLKFISNISIRNSLIPRFQLVIT